MSNELLKRVIVAADVPDFGKAKMVVDETKGTLEYIKIGMQAFFGFGEKIIPYARDNGFRIFLDLKLCDIPNTVSSAIRSLARYRFELLTVHISGGERMLKEAVSTLKDVLSDSGVIGVTVLTSLNEDDLRSIGFGLRIEDTITNMVRLAVKSGLYGIVCSASDLRFVKPVANGNLKIITPGIRLPDDKATDQKRVETPVKAFESGADFIVMGRPIIEGDIRKNLERLSEHLDKGKSDNGR